MFSIKLNVFLQCLLEMKAEAVTVPYRRHRVPNEREKVWGQVGLLQNGKVAQYPMYRK
jgi:hypothetical protein